MRLQNKIAVRIQVCVYQMEQSAVILAGTPDIKVGVFPQITEDIIVLWLAVIDCALHDPLLGISAAVARLDAKQRVVVRRSRVQRVEQIILVDHRGDLIHAVGQPVTIAHCRVRRGRENGQKTQQHRHCQQERERTSENLTVHYIIPFLPFFLASFGTK